MVPYKGHFKNPDKQVDAALIVAFDAESDHHVEVVEHGGKMHAYDVSDLLCFTFAAWGRDGSVLVDRWDIEEPPTMAELEDHIRVWLDEPGRPIYLLTHWSLAELRHISDFKEYAKNHTVFIHESSMHVITESLKIIDTFPYFNSGLDAVAPFAKMKKIELGNRPDGEPWIKHMRELKAEHPDIFWPYAENDSVILLKAFSEFRKIIWETFTVEILRNPRMTPTLPAIAIRILRRDYLDCPVQPTAKWFEPTQHPLKDGSYVAGKDRETEVLDQNVFLQIRRYALRSAWGAPRCAFGCGFYDKPVTRLDSKGHYNVSSMLQPLPNARTVWLHLKGADTLDEILKCEGYVRLNEPREESSHPTLAKKPTYSKRLLFTKSDDEVYTTIFELRLALKHTALRFTDIEAYGFIPTENEIRHPLVLLMERFGKMKTEGELEAKALGVDKDEYLPYAVGKLLSNALLGKLIQAVENDRYAQEEFFDMGMMDYDFVKPSRGKWSTPHKRVSMSAFAPEWSALILGRARGILGFTALLTNPITCHTDSIDFPANPELEAEVIKRIKEEYGFTFEKKYDADGLWLMRAAVNIALTRKDGKWEVLIQKQKDGTMKPMVANHAIHTGRKPGERKQFYQPVIDALNGGEWSPDLKVYEERIVYPLSEKNHGNVHFGSSYRNESSVHVMWDYKRKLPADFDIKRDLFNRFAWTEPYDSVREARLAEDAHDRDEKDVQKGGPRKTPEGQTVRRAQTKLSKSEQKTADLAEIRRYLDEGLSGNEVADKFVGRHSRSTIQRLIRVKNVR
jgi:hypothetical protein